MTCKQENGIRLHVDRKVLRDIIQARVADGKRRSFFTIGNLFTGMGFTLVAMGSNNYTASSLFVLIGLFVYMCVGGVSVDYEGSSACADADDWKEPARCAHYDAESADSEAEAEYHELSQLGKEEKMVIFRSLFQELSGLDVTDEDVERILWVERMVSNSCAGIDADADADSDADADTDVDSESEADAPDTPPSSEAPSSDAGLTVIEEASTEVEAEAESPVEDSAAPRLARAETSYSQTEVQPIAAPEEEQRNNTEGSGSVA